MIFGNAHRKSSFTACRSVKYHWLVLRGDSLAPACKGSKWYGHPIPDVKREDLNCEACKALLGRSE